MFLVSQNAIGVCSAAMGMESLEITNEQITASSSYGGGHEPWKGRLHYLSGGGAYSWCPSSSDNQYIQVDLGHVTAVTGVAVQGRGNAARYILTYQVHLSLNQSTWKIYSEDGTTPKVQTFDQFVLQYQGA